MITFTPNTANELQLTDEQLQVVTGGWGCHERRRDCDDGGWDRDGWRGNEWDDRRRRGCGRERCESESFSRSFDDVSINIL